MAQESLNEKHAHRQSETFSTQNPAITITRVVSSPSDLPETVADDNIPTIPTAQQNTALLPPKDRGYKAYRTLAAAVILEAVTLGVPLAYGIYQDYYSTLFPDNTTAPWIGVLSGGMPFLGAPLVTFCCDKYNLNLRHFLWAGWSLCWMSLVASLWCTSLQVLVVTQGFLYGLGSLLFELPLLTLINSWFDKKRGLAYGVIFGGADLFAFGNTFLVSYLLKRFGPKVTLTVSALLLINLGGGAILLLKPRPADNLEPTTTETTATATPRRDSIPSPLVLPNQPDSKTPPPTIRYFKRPLFYLFALANLAQALSYYLPFIYLPSFTTDLNYTHDQAALVLALANLSQVLGEVGFGKLSDHLPVPLLLLISTAIASIATFTIWGLVASKSLAAIIVFAVFFATFGSGFMALWARMATMFDERDTQMVFSHLSFGRGLGAILSGPVSSALLSMDGGVQDKIGVDISAFGAGKYSGIVGFVGGCMACSAVVGVVCWFAVWWRECDGLFFVGGRKEREVEAEKVKVDFGWDETMEFVNIR